MNADSNGNRRREQIATVVRKLLGSLELEVMEYMWQAGEATVGQVTKAVESRRPIAYTTAMTVMVHLVDKGLLVRSKEGKRYRYRVAKSREDFLRETSRSMVRALVNDLGDLAIVGFLGEINKLEPGKLEQLRSLLQESGARTNATG